MNKLLLALPVFTWSYFCYVWYKERKRKREQLSNYKKNNRVITYAVNRTVKGHCEVENIQELEVLTLNCSPLVDFLRGTQKSLDIAMMSFTINMLINILRELKENGVKIRLITDTFDNTKSMKDAVSQVKWNNNLKTIDSIFHNKYIIRDYNEETCAVLNGSLNFTMQGVYENYEDVIITTNKKVLDNMQKNFDEIWKYFPLRY